MQVSLRVYREVRAAAQQALAEIRRAGYTSLTIEGKDEAAEILRLTCLEQGLSIEHKSARVPSLRSDGATFVITWPGPSGDETAASGKKNRDTTRRNHE